ncbi:MAG TPA: M14 family zinc carboxypeptidase [Thermoanaerobaculia bacterium]|nr:M14 family zinc carboxypeptidase [Thermoanaerobaculia bacterium]
MTVVRRLAAVLALLVWATAGSAQQSIPTPDEFLGYPLGERFTPHHRIVDYFRELALRSDLISLETIGETYEGRSLVLATITSPANRAKLDTVRANLSALVQADATDPARAAEIARTTPAVVWLAFGVHGNESSSAEAAMRVAHSLLQDSSSRMRDELVLLVDPLQNPDGRERYVEWFRRTRGREPNPNPDAFEHTEPWPGGRYNHYLIDMNRDWTWMSQRETRARVAKYREWNPQVYVDFHEMSYQSSYFFPPDAKPINTNLPREVEKWLELFGRANATEFSRRGWPFFVGERFDLFYPGYGDAWPSLHGAIGMTYEMAGHGRAGVVIEREDGTRLTLRDRIERHYTTAMTTVATAAEHRDALLQYTYGAMRVHLEGPRSTYLVLPGSPNYTTLVETLLRQGIRLGMLSAPATIRATRLDRDAQESRSFPAGTAVISTRQPLGGLVQTLLERDAQLHTTFLDEQRSKAEADEPDDFYDLTTWSMPLAMNVETYVTNASIPGQLAPWAPPHAAPFTAASYGYLVSGFDPNVYRFAGRLVRHDIRFNVANGELVFGEQTHPRGSIVILKGNNPDVDQVLSAIVRETGVSLVPLESGWIGGTTFGSEKIRFVREPKIALIGGPGTGSTSFGMLWHTLDVDTPIPHTTISLDALGSVDLQKYNVIVLPDGNYTDRIRKREIEKLKVWLNGGGTLVAVKGASAFLRHKDVAISKVKPWEPPKTERSEDTEAGDPAAAESQPETPDQRYNDFRVPGSAFKTTMNERSYLTYGVPRAPAVLIEGSSAHLPVSHRVDNIVTVAQEEPLVSGVAWPESIERIAGSAYLIAEPVGRGSVITFADEPHFRLFWRGTLPLFLNAVLYSPSFPR